MCDMHTSSKLWGAIDMLERKDALQRALNRLERWSHANLLKVYKASVRSCAWVWPSPCRNIGWVENGLRGTLGRRSLAHPNVGTTKAQHDLAICTCSPEIQLHLDLCLKSAFPAGEGKQFSLYSALVKPCLENCIQRRCYRHNNGWAP